MGEKKNEVFNRDINDQLDALEKEQGGAPEVVVVEETVTATPVPEEEKNSGTFQDIVDYFNKNKR